MGVVWYYFLNYKIFLENLFCLFHYINSALSSLQNRIIFISSQPVHNIRNFLLFALSIFDRIAFAGLKKG